MANWIRTTGATETVTPKDGKSFRLEELQRFVGGCVEALQLNDGTVMWLNEDGKQERLPLNETADLIAHEQSGIAWHDRIVGDVLIATRAETGDDQPDRD